MLMIRKIYNYKEKTALAVYYFFLALLFPVHQNQYGGLTTRSSDMRLIKQMP